MKGVVHMKNNLIQKTVKQFRLQIPNELHAQMKRAFNKQSEIGSLHDFIVISAYEKAQEILNRQNQ